MLVCISEPHEFYALMPWSLKPIPPFWWYLRSRFLSERVLMFLTKFWGNICQRMANEIASSNGIGYRSAERGRIRLKGLTFTPLR